jgi:hypothetical protein
VLEELKVYASVASRKCDEWGMLVKASSIAISDLEAARYGIQQVKQQMDKQIDEREAAQNSYTFFSFLFDLSH